MDHNLRSGFTDVNATELKLKLPLGLIISGPSSSGKYLSKHLNMKYYLGKTTFLLNLLRNYAEMFIPAPPSPGSILYCYGQYHPHVAELENSGYKICAGQPSDETISSLIKPSIIVLDDLMLSLSERWLSDMFTKRSHHENFAVILLCQNLFQPALRIARVNSHYICLMRSPAAQLQIRNLGAQLFPRQLAYFLDAYKKATEMPYGYLFIDLYPSTIDLLRLRTNIFPTNKDSHEGKLNSCTIFAPL